MQAVLRKLEKEITKILIKDNLNEMERAKISFGVKLLINDFWKIFIIYSITFLLDCILYTLLTHSMFILLRQVCFGYHFKNEFICLAVSIISFSIIVYTIPFIQVDSLYLYLIGIFSTIFILMIAPVATIKRPIFNLKHRKFLRKKLYFRLVIVWILILLIPQINIYIIYSLLLVIIPLLVGRFTRGK